MNKLRPDVDEYVRQHLGTFRAPTHKATHYGLAGRVHTVKPGERIIYAPDGTPIRIIEDQNGGTQVEHGDHLHAVIRPQTIVGGAESFTP
jgi:hypothetical protein